MEQEGYRITVLERIDLPVGRPQVPRSPTAREPGEEADTIPFRPVRRPPMAALCILFDGRDDGEWVRLCEDRMVIGRSEGNVTVPHDGMMSGRHAELVREGGADGYQWHLVDLQSRNGTFVRIAKTILRGGQEFLLGCRRYRFHVASGPESDGGATADAGTPPRKGTVGWQTLAPSDVLPSIIEVTPEGEGQKWLLAKSEYLIGRDDKLCGIAIKDDPMLSPRHAKLGRDAKGRWFLENTGSRNGVWLRVSRVAMEGTANFLLGEQRFLMRVP